MVREMDYARRIGRAFAVLMAAFLCGYYVQSTPAVSAVMTDSAVAQNSLPPGVIPMDCGARCAPATN